MRVFSRRSAFVLLTFVAAGILASCGNKAPDASGPFGKTRVASFVAPPKVLEEFAKHQATPRNPKLSALENVAFAEGVFWSAPPLTVAPANSPYRVAVKIEATAPAAGPATSMWLVGWTRLDQDGEPLDTRQGIVAQLGDGDIPADRQTAARTVVRVGASGPVSFREESQVVPVIEMKQLTNLSLKRIEVEVWSGLPSASWIELLSGWQALLIGLVMLSLWFVWFRKKD